MTGHAATSLCAAHTREASIRVKQGRRFQVRLWPNPVFREEYAPGRWRDVVPVKDDFNYTILKEARDRLVRRYRWRYPGLVGAILADASGPPTSNLPVDLWALNRLQSQIRSREHMLRVIPPDILECVRRFGEGHFHLLQCFAHCSDALVLASDHPALAFLGALHQQFPGTTATVDRAGLCAMLRRRRPEILAWLGFPGADNSLVRLLGKITPNACRLGLLSGLGNAVCCPETRRVLRHIPRIPLGVLELVSDATLRRRVSTALLCQTALIPQEDQVPETAWKLLWCLKWHEAGLLRLPDTVRSHRALEALFRQGVEMLTPDDIERLALPFPDPPLPETCDIRALTTADDLFTEGLEQLNCAWTLMPDVVSGALFLYRVLAPERATLSLRRCRGAWHIQELEVAGNRPVSQATRAFVEAWLVGAPENAEENVRACGAGAM